MSHPLVQKNDELRVNILQFLLLHSFFTVSQPVQGISLVILLPGTSSKALVFWLLLRAITIPAVLIFIDATEFTRMLNFKYILIHSVVKLLLLLKIM